MTQNSQTTTKKDETGKSTKGEYVKRNQSENEKNTYQKTANVKSKMLEKVEISYHTSAHTK